ncbi:hypothetical protein, partial [Streptomyces xanthophaeus]|uniref:hypothetical protein n=1 Tax=Streptomyces xanthophaeus TaxID=67385 RepID=UPI00371C6565
GNRVRPVHGSPGSTPRHGTGRRGPDRHDPKETTYRIWQTRGGRWWGELYELCPDDLLAELNGKKDPEKITALLRRYRALKR